MLCMNVVLCAGDCFTEGIAGEKHRRSVVASAAFAGRSRSLSGWNITELWLTTSSTSIEAFAVERRTNPKINALKIIKQKYGNYSCTTCLPVHVQYVLKFRCMYMYITFSLHIQVHVHVNVNYM